MLLKRFRNVIDWIDHKNLFKRGRFFREFLAITIVCGQYAVDFSNPAELFCHSNV